MERIQRFTCLFSALLLVILISLSMFAETAHAEDMDIEVDSSKTTDITCIDSDAAANYVQDFISENDTELSSNTVEEGTESAESLEFDILELENDLSDVEDADSLAASIDNASYLISTGDKYSIPEGDYVIKSSLPGCYVLDVSDGSTYESANIQIYSYNATGAQQWHVSINSDGTYLIKNIKSGLLLGITSSTVGNGANISQNPDGSSLNQKWLIESLNGGFRIVSALEADNGKKYVLDVAGGRAADGSNVQLYEANATSAQKFFLNLLPDESVKYDTPLEAGDYLIQSSIGGAYVIDVCGASTSNGANTQIYSYNGSIAQKWSVSYDDAGLYTFTSKVGSHSVLDVSHGVAAYGQNVWQFESNDSNAQKWIVVKDGVQYKIMSAIDPMFVLDVSGSRAADGSNLQLYADNGTSAQRFLFVPLAVSLPSEGGVADGVYAIAVRSENNDYVLDVSGGSLSNGSNVQLFKANGTNAQRWGIVRVADGNGEGLYSIFNIASGKMLDISGGCPLSGVNVQQYDSNGSKAQSWSFIREEDSYTILSSVSGMALDIAGGRIVSNAANVQVFVPNGTAAQKFTIIPVPIIDDGNTYSLVISRNTNLAADVPGCSQGDGKELQVFSSNDSPAQHMVARKMEDGSFKFQMVGSGKYLTDENDRVVQRFNTASAAQQWLLSIDKSGVIITNVATGKTMSVGSSIPHNGTALITCDQMGPDSIMGFRSCELISDGIYILTSLASKAGFVLDVSGGSRNNGANAQIYASNNTNAQKFALKRVNDDYYKITMALSSQALDVAGGSWDSGANVQFYYWNGSDAQLWKPTITDNGLTFVNKGSGKLLEVNGGVDYIGANIDQNDRTESYSQSWMLNPTCVNWTDLNSITNLVWSIPSSSDVQSTFEIDPTAWGALMNALGQIWNEGYDVGFLMTDLQTGNSVSLNADKVFYGACTIKAPYISWIFQELLENGYTDWGAIESRVRPAIILSENSTYLSLRNQFGNAGFESWLRGAGLYNLGYSTYDFYTPRDLQLMWTRILAYEQSNGAFTGTWREIFGQTGASPIADELRWENAALYSKPGWYPTGSEYGTLSDSGIVVCNDGRRYLLTIMTSVSPYTDYELHQGVARALHTIFCTSSPRI